MLGHKSPVRHQRGTVTEKLEFDLKHLEEIMDEKSVEEIRVFLFAVGESIELLACNKQLQIGLTAESCDMIRHDLADARIAFCRSIKSISDNLETIARKDRRVARKGEFGRLMLWGGMKAVTEQLVSSLDDIGAGKAATLLTSPDNQLHVGSTVKWPTDLRELCALQKKELLLFRGIGPNAIEQLCGVLADYGLMLGMSEEELEEAFGKKE